jgi:hexosaminidase
MKTTILNFLLLFIIVAVQAQRDFSLIPYPNKLTPSEGAFEIRTSLSVKIPSEFKSELAIMTEIFAEENTIKLIPSKKGTLVFNINPQMDKEEYSISVTKDKISVEVSTSTGCFWAFQTIRQLMNLNPMGAYMIQTCTIHDKPAFEWRGAMMDVARTFMRKAAIKSFIDEMSRLKMNVLRLHLTDNQGWRIEISKYPKLTEIGAWREKTSILSYPLKGWAATVWDNIQPPAYGDQPYGGYYTKDDIRELVAYASKRHITIVPEIELPGHSYAAIKSYPWLGSNKAAANNPKEPDALNVADEKVCLFVEDVLKEVMELFPGKIIHIGGDEVVMKAWQDNGLITEFMQKNGLKNYTDLQLNFSNRIGSFLAKSGFRMMGWNEIYGKNVRASEGVSELTIQNSNIKLDKNTIVQFWMGEPELLNEVVENRYDIVYSEIAYTYTTFSYKYIPLSKAYATSPIPKGIAPEKVKHILGLECPMWSENSIRTTGFYPYLYPRIAAYAEAGWTDQSNKDYDRFKDSLWKLKKHWDERGILYSDSIN